MSVRLLAQAGGNAAGEDTTPPAAPVGVYTSAVTQTEFRVNWTANTEPDVQNYRTYRSSVSGSSGFALVGTTPHPTTSFLNTNLTASTQYWVYVTAVDNAGNESPASSVVTVTTSAAPAGSNASRVAASMNGRTPQFAYNVPADPSTNQTINITAGDSAALAAAVQTSGALINVPAGTYTTDLFFYANDVDLVMDNGATVVGNVTFGNGPTGAAGRNRRVRWTGGNIDGTTITLNHFDDLMVDDVYIATNNAFNEMSGGSDGTDDGWRRICFRNVTFQDRLPANGGPPYGWNWFTQGYTSAVTEDLLWLGIKSITNGAQNNRIQGITRFVCVDSAFNHDFNSANGMRNGAGPNGICTDLYLDNCIINDGYLLNYSTFNANQNVANYFASRIHRYHSAAGFWNYADQLPGNTGTVRDSIAFGHGGTPPSSMDGVSPFTSINNTAQLFDGVTPPTTMPDGVTLVSQVGAVRP